jgi:hypothetical protein
MSYPIEPNPLRRERLLNLASLRRGASGAETSEAPTEAVPSSGEAAETEVESAESPQK